MARTVVSWVALEGAYAEANVRVVVSWVALEGVATEAAAITGTGALVAGAATAAGVGEVTGEVIVPPISVGGGIVRPPRPFPIEGIGYGILPSLEGEAAGQVGVVGSGLGELPSLAGDAEGEATATGSGQGNVRAFAGTALAVSGAAGDGQGQVRGLSGSGRSVIGTSGLVRGAVALSLRGDMRGNHDPDEPAIVAWLLAA